MTVYEKIPNAKDYPFFKKIITQDIEPRERLINLIFLIDTSEGYYELKFDHFELLKGFVDIRNPSN